MLTRRKRHYHRHASLLYHLRKFVLCCANLSYLCYLLC